jgi:hypothetical protein
MTTDSRICPSCQRAPVNPGTQLCQRCHANAGLLSRVAPALLSYLQNHPRPDAVASEMCDLLLALSRLGRADTEPVTNNGASDDDADEYPLEWLLDAPPLDDDTQDRSLDPSSAAFLNGWRPTSAQDGLAKELALAHFAADDDPAAFNRLFLAFCADRYTELSWPQFTLALLEALKATAVGTQGHGLAVARLADDVKIARELALEEQR